MNRKKYSIVWKAFPPSVGFISASGATFPLHVPLFLEGHDLEVFEATGGLAFYPFNVLRGILVGLQDNPPTLDLPSIRPFLLKGLELLQCEFNAETMESLILDLAAHLRENHGIDPACSALKTGQEILPHSQKILSDLIMCLWRAAVDDESYIAIDEIARHGPTIDLKEIDTTVAPNLVYVVFAALHHCGMVDAADTYYHTAVVPYLAEGILRERVERVRNCEDLSLAEMDE